MKKTYKILKDAREIVRTRWRKGLYGEPGGPRCAIGALGESAGIDPIWAHSMSYKPYKVLAECVGKSNHIRSVSVFNDSHTQEEVIDLFTNAMRKAR